MMYPCDGWLGTLPTSARVARAREVEPRADEVYHAEGDRMGGEVGA